MRVPPLIEQIENRQKKCVENPPRSFLASKGVLLVLHPKEINISIIKRNTGERDLSEHTTFLAKNYPKGEREDESEKAYRREHDLLFFKREHEPPRVKYLKCRKKQMLPYSHYVKEFRNRASGSGLLKTRGKSDYEIISTRMVIPID